MRERSEVDPELHILRTLARGLPDPRERHGMESARFNLYAAFEARDPDGALRWLRALEVAVRSIRDVSLRRAGLEALATIAEALPWVQPRG